MHDRALGTSRARETGRRWCMTTKKKTKAKTKKKSERPYQKTSRCWPGYAPVPGKRANEEGSCRKVPASKNAGVEVDREEARRRAEEEAGSDEERAAIKSKSSSPRVRAAGRRLRDKAKR